jgi:hypothetical protein
VQASRIRTLLTGLAAGVAYAFLTMLLVSASHRNVSVGFIFVLPLVMGAIPVLFSTREQLQAYKSYLLLPWGIVFTFFYLSFVRGFEGMICLVIIVAPFLLLGTLGAFVFRLLKLRSEGPATKLYASLLLPFLTLLLESQLPVRDYYYTVRTTTDIAAAPARVWHNVRDVPTIRRAELAPHFVHLIGIPRPLDGRLDRDGVGGIRHITWEKDIRFEEKITAWEPGKGFSYDIHVDPNSIPPTTLDEHVMIGGRYFDVVSGRYALAAAGPAHTRVTLSCTYRISTNLNAYSRLWADFILDDFNQMILEVIKKRSEAAMPTALAQATACGREARQ